ncbi:hypothetical protein CK203_023571 [Vitis vinifera]|uniref:Uncharacterized protein n=1 Tax=Vitis vinifera TaxID=29760 RepID=A0A438JBM9_VITVI|nr:hypothetical protein CK203_023571 [Vitis vinifera]
MVDGTRKFGAKNRWRRNLSLLKEPEPTHPCLGLWLLITNDTIFEEMKKEYMAQQEGKGPVTV